MATETVDEFILDWHGGQAIGVYQKVETEGPQARDFLGWWEGVWAGPPRQMMLLTTEAWLVYLPVPEEQLAVLEERAEHLKEMGKLYPSSRQLNDDAMSADPMHFWLEEKRDA